MSSINDITKIPIVVLEALKQYMDVKDKKFIRVEHEEYYLYLKGTNINESSFFGIKMHEIKNNSIAFLVSNQPTSKIHPDKSQQWLNEASLKANFLNWTKLLQTYEEMSEIYQTTDREKQFTEEFFAEFEFVDEQEAEKGFTSFQIIELDNRLEQFKLKIHEIGDRFSPEILIEIQNEIEVTQNGLVQNSKKWFAKQLARIQAKIMKQGPKLLKDTSIELLKSVAVDYIKGRLLGM